MKNSVQIRNPRTGHYTRVDKSKGTLKHKRTPGPWKGIPIVRAGHAR